VQGTAVDDSRQPVGAEQVAIADQGGAERQVRLDRFCACAEGADPVQGYVLQWRRHSYHWTALVLTSSVDEAGRPTAMQQ
jgi:hypothetical protein